MCIQICIYFSLIPKRKIRTKKKKSKIILPILYFENIILKKKIKSIHFICIIHISN